MDSPFLTFLFLLLFFGNFFFVQSGRANLEGFRGVAFVGGFSYADVLDSGKGWAGVIRYHKELLLQFQAFYNR